MVALVDSLLDGCGVVDGDAVARRHTGLDAAVAGGGRRSGEGEREVPGPMGNVGMYLCSDEEA